MGYVDSLDAVSVVTAIEQALNACGFVVTPILVLERPSKSSPPELIQPRQPIAVRAQAPRPRICQVHLEPGRYNYNVRLILRQQSSSLGLWTISVPSQYQSCTSYRLFRPKIGLFRTVNPQQAFVVLLLRSCPSVCQPMSLHPDRLF